MACYKTNDLDLNGCVASSLGAPEWSDLPPINQVGFRHFAALGYPLSFFNTLLSTTFPPNQLKWTESTQLSTPKPEEKGIVPKLEGQRFAKQNQWVKRIVKGRACSGAGLKNKQV